MLSTGFALEENRAERTGQIPEAAVTRKRQAVVQGMVKVNTNVNVETWHTGHIISRVK